MGSRSDLSFLTRSLISARSPVIAKKQNVLTIIGWVIKSTSPITGKTTKQQDSSNRLGIAYKKATKHW